MKALGNRVIIAPDSVEKETEWGFEIVGDKDERMEKAGITIGTIVQIGPAAWLDPMLGGEPQAEVGDRVLYAKYACKYITNPEDGKEYVVVNDDGIQVRL